MTGEERLADAQDDQIHNISVIPAMLIVLLPQEAFYAFLEICLF